MIQSLSSLRDSIDKHLKQNNAYIISNKRIGEGYEMTIRVFTDIDCPEHYKITIERI